jgi:hypothetical protein
MDKLYGILRDNSDFKPQLLQITCFTKKDRNNVLRYYHSKPNRNKKILKLNRDKILPVTIIIEKGSIYPRNMNYERRRPSFFPLSKKEQTNG